MPARYYTYKAGPVQFIAIDTEGWSDAQLEWIKQTLTASADDPDIKWRVVYGHHPIYTSGVHLNERRIGELRLKLLPVLKAAHVDVYICGHDHDLEHLRSDGMEFLICGGGGAKLRGFWHKDPLSVFTDVDPRLSGYHHRRSQVHGAIFGRESQVAGGPGDDCDTQVS